MTLEERIKRIIFASEIELDGEAYIGKYELDSAKSIKNFISKKLKGTYTNLVTNNKINVSGSSAEKLAGHWKDGEAYQKSLAHIPQVIEKMLFLEEMSPEGDNAKYHKYYYYITPAKIDGKQYTILSTVGRTDQEIYYDQNVFYGTPQEVFAKVELEASNAKYSRLNAILNKKAKATENRT